MTYTEALGRFERFIESRLEYKESILLEDKEVDEESFDLFTEVLSKVKEGLQTLVDKENSCIKCIHGDVDADEEPCAKCLSPLNSVNNFEPKEV